MKWLSEIFVVCLCLLLGGLWFAHQQQAAHIDRLNVAMGRHNVGLRLSNQEFLFIMSEEIREAVMNRGRMKNKGLLDTLGYLNKQMDQLLEKTALSNTEVWRQISWMKEVYDEQLLDKNKAMTIISFDSLQRITLPERITQLLFKERELLELLNLRLGISSSGPDKLIVEHIPMTTSVLAGETLQVWFQLPIWLGWDRGVQFEAKRGEITHHPGESHAILTLPTDQVLKPGQQEGWLHYGVQVIIPRVTGGYETLPVEGKIKVVRSPHTPETN